MHNPIPNVPKLKGHHMRAPFALKTVFFTSSALLMSVFLIGLSAAQAQEKSLAPPVTVVQAISSEVIDRVPVSGTLVPRNEILIYPQISGFTLDSINVDIGDVVKKGDVLANLNNSTLKAQLAQSQAGLAQAQAGVGQAKSQIQSAQASFTQAQSTLQRTEQLRTSGATTQTNLDQAIAVHQTSLANLASAHDGLAVAQAQQQQAQAQLVIGELNLDYARIIAPVDGIVAARNGQVGAIATSAGEPIFRIIEDGLIEIEVEIVETAMGSIARGNIALLDIAGVGDIEGEVRLISPIVDPVTRLGSARITTESNDHLRAGLFAGGWIITDKHQSVTVPATAVLTDADGTYVLLVQGDILERRSVLAGLIWKNNREVVEGLEIGDSVVAKSGAFYADGDKILPVMDGAKAASEASK